MHRSILCLVLLICGTVAGAAELGNHAPPKSDARVLQNPAWDRDGGEAIVPCELAGC
jgi:hypothetical protein